MKKILDLLPSILLVTFFFLTTFIPFNLGIIIGFVTSAILFAYQQHLLRTDQPDLSKEIKKIHAELYNKIELSKQDSAKELSDLKTEMSKFSLTMSRIPGIVEKPKDRTKIQF